MSSGRVDEPTAGDRAGGYVGGTEPFDPERDGLLFRGCRLERAEEVKPDWQLFKRAHLGGGHQRQGKDAHHLVPVSLTDTK